MPEITGHQLGENTIRQHVDYAVDKSNRVFRTTEPLRPEVKAAMHETAVEFNSKRAAERKEYLKQKKNKL